MKRLKIFFILFVLTLSACAHLGEKKRLEHLEAKQKLFMKALRWKSYDTAASLIRFKNPARKLASIEYLNRITVTSYDLISLQPDLAQGTATAYVLFAYIQDESGRVYKLKHTQNWWFDKESKQWFLASDLPMFKVD